MRNSCLQLLFFIPDCRVLCDPYELALSQYGKEVYSRVGCRIYESVVLDSV